MIVWLSSKVVSLMTEEANKQYPLETGGVLLGWKQKQEFVIADVVGPGPTAKHDKHTFYPDHDWQVTNIETRFRLSGGQLNYLGDWHTHPNTKAQMSSLDNSTLRHISISVPSPLMMILGGGVDGDWRDRACWCCVHQSFMFINFYEIQKVSLKCFDDL